MATDCTKPKLAGVLGFMSGLGRGLSSLVMHVSEGTLTSVSDLSSSLMRNVDNLSLDRYHPAS
jgi:vacuolar protein sorting-associated protein 13B